MGLDLGVENEHKGATGSADNVGEGSLEEGEGTFLGEDLLEAVSSAGVLNVGAGTAGLHHQATADGVKGVGEDTGEDGDDLGEHPHGEHAGVFGIGEEDGLSGIVATEVGSAVGNNTNNGDTETTVESSGTIGGGDLLEAVDETTEFTGTTGTDISGEAGTGEVKGVDDAEGGSAGGSSGGAVTDEELNGFLLGVVGVEDLLVDILEGKVEGLSGEVSHDVGEVTSPEGSETLLVEDAGEAVTNALVLVLGGDGLGGILNLEEELDTLDGGDDGLGDGGGDTTDHEVGNEVRFLLGHFMVSYVYVFRIFKLNKIYQHAFL